MKQIDTEYITCSYIR